MTDTPRLTDTPPRNDTPPWNDTEFRDIDAAPLGVKLLSMVVVVAAILDLSLASLMILNSGSGNLRAETGLSGGGLVAYGLVIGALGLVAFAVGIGLRAGSAWARVLTIVLALVRLAGLGFAMLVFDNSQWYTAIVPAVIYAVVAYYLLYDTEARDYYAT